MKITIIDPHHAIGDYRTDGSKKYFIHGWGVEFIKKYKPNIYITNIRQYLKIRKFFKDINENINDYIIYFAPLSKQPILRRFIKNKKGTGEFNISSFSRKSLYSNTDVLLYMNGGIYTDMSLFKEFNGLKIYHIMDPQYLARELGKYLDIAGIDYLLGYNSYDKHSDFVKLLYPGFENRIIGLPFGYGSMWNVITPFEKRKNKAILTGTMETFEYVKNSSYYEYVYDYYNYFNTKYNSMHEIRYIIDRDISYFSDCIDSKIHHWPKKDNFIKDVVAEFNKYKFFINDESLLNFCPIRTYEGIAAGCVMLAHDTTCYEEWGFKDGLNCIKFDRVEEIPEKIKYYLKNTKLLDKIRKNALDFVKCNYNHQSIADLLYEKIHNAYSK